MELVDGQEDSNDLDGPLVLLSRVVFLGLDHLALACQVVHKAGEAFQQGQVH